MPSTINADNGVVSGSAGLKSNADASGVLQLQTNGTTALSVSAAQVVTLTNALGVSSGGTGLTSGTSGGVPYYSASTTIASSAALAANALVIGGGAGVAPSTTTTGTGVLTALGTAVGSAGAFVVNGGALGTPSSGTVTNLTGTASININGTVGATTANTGNFTSVTSTSEVVTGASGVLTRAAATQDGVALAGRAGGTSSYTATITPTTLTASRTVTLPNETFTVGFRNIPAVGTQTGSYSLGTNDVGKYVQVSTGGSITVPNNTFAEGDVITIFNNTTGNITMTMSITTAYIAGTNTDKDTMALATRGVATILFISGTVCVVSGNVS